MQWLLVHFSRTSTKMSKPKKNSALFDGKVDNKLCLNCGFPNRESDRHCMYCKTSLLEDGFFSWIRETYYILIWRWQLKRKRDHLNVFLKPRLSFLKIIGYLLFGLVLTISGVYLFSDALADSSFSSSLIACLFLYYGVLTLRGIFVKK